MSTWDLFIGNGRITNYTKVSVKEANLTDREMAYVKMLAEKTDAQQALDKYMKFTGWGAKKKLVNGKQTVVYTQTPVNKRLDNIRKMANLTQQYREA